MRKGLGFSSGLVITIQHLSVARVGCEQAMCEQMRSLLGLFGRDQVVQEGSFPEPGRPLSRAAQPR
jgi:hypothetical protein